MPDNCAQFVFTSSIDGHCRTQEKQKYGKRYAKYDVHGGTESGQSRTFHLAGVCANVTLNNSNHLQFPRRNPQTAEKKPASRRGKVLLDRGPVPSVPSSGPSQGPLDLTSTPGREARHKGSCAWPTMAVDLRDKATRRRRSRTKRRGPRCRHLHRKRDEGEVERR